ncbi:hypothetical protein BKG82_25870 [Mycobacteroides chelonae]|uniref:Uncharacterized protein n=3 Tax=Mycobacteriaceae TaxID=1762 RepID=A0A1A6BFY2_MYCGO|nr:hypothetical protein AOT88_21445 [Mycobacteroides sp. H063]KRQ56912.1 hypothetical protein AOT94_17860 [Mycobacteroides sp. HXVII]KRQ80154.1 hypothetical protein AOT95_14595 [Mycobacteroides sp. HXXIII]OBS01228.1 hypothetical protein A9W98_21130 [Mycobacterium gordonae]OHU28854.1 hypothetical protein BKG74_05485 [Mycobacteroides chelonae]ORV97850.1 hypothetical protein AWC13_14880 [Mycobacterium kubicae]ORW34362.1 hypothetical protein AWC17_24390 [Mycobacterium nebraskense]
MCPAPLSITTTFFTGIIKVSGPVLRLQYGPTEVLLAGKVWSVTRVVVVIAATHEDEPRLEL